MIMKRIIIGLARSSPLDTLPSSKSNFHFISASLSVLKSQHHKTATFLNHYVRWISVGVLKTSRFATGFSALQPKSLNALLDMELEHVKDRSPEDLASFWNDCHLGRGHIGLSMKAKSYQLLEQRAMDCQYFVIPLRRGTGYTTMFMQVQVPQMLFTGLEDYKARGTQASPYCTVCFYTEFAESKGLVLIRGDVIFTSKLSDAEAKWLLEAGQSFYLSDDKYPLVQLFNKRPREFDFKGVLRALEMPVM